MNNFFKKIILLAMVLAVGNSGFVNAAERANNRRWGKYLALAGLGVGAVAIVALMAKSRTNNAQCHQQLRIVSGSYERSENFTLPNLEEIHITGISGDITVTGEDRQDVSVSAIVRANSQQALNNTKIEYVIEDNKNNVRTKSNAENVVVTQIQTSFFGWCATSYSSYGSNAAVDYAIKVPQSIGFVNVENNSGNLDMQSVEGRLQLKTHSGNIGVNQAKRSVKAHSNSGHVNVTFHPHADNNADAIVGTNSGNVKVVGTKSSVKAQNNLGDVHVECAVLPQDAKIKLETSNGNNILLIPRFFRNPAVSLRTSFGNNSSKFDFLRDAASRQDFRYSGEDGGANISLSTSCGNNSVDCIE